MGLDNLKNVMVIDDNDTDLLIAKIVIEKSGFKGNIVTKNSGKNALEYLDSIQSKTDLWPDVIFLDINMPVVNGFVFLYEFEKMPEDFRKKVKIAVLTSSDNKTDMEKFMVSESVIDFVSKPISIEGFNSVAEKFK
jgi:CheY-like chemotaxis protein